VQDEHAIERLITHVRQLNAHAALDFVFVELRVGLTSCKTARARHRLGLDPAPAIEIAEHALKTAEKLMRRFRKNHPVEYRQMVAQAEHLRAELDALKRTNICASQVNA